MGKNAVLKKLQGHIVKRKWIAGILLCLLALAASIALYAKCHTGSPPPEPGSDKNIPPSELYGVTVEFADRFPQGYVRVDSGAAVEFALLLSLLNGDSGDFGLQPAEGEFQEAWVYRFVFVGCDFLLPSGEIGTGKRILVYTGQETVSIGGNLFTASPEFFSELDKIVDHLPVAYYGENPYYYEAINVE